MGTVQFTIVLGLACSNKGKGKYGIGKKASGRNGSRKKGQVEKTAKNYGKWQNGQKANRHSIQMSPATVDLKIRLI
jgi:hypothetical protein